MDDAVRADARPHVWCRALNNCQRLHERIEHGWWKLNHDGSRTVAGLPPYLDLYAAIRSLESRFPVLAEMSAIFDRLARTVADLYPDRVQTEMQSPYDSRIVLFEFNDAPGTTQLDVMSVLTLSKEIINELKSSK